MRRASVLLLVGLPLAGLDLAVKATLPTPYWAYHQRSYGWVALCCALLVALVLLTRLPSRVIPPAAGVLAAGVVGNGLSAAWSDLHVPNPLVVERGRAVFAFNLADLYVLGGLVLVTVTVGTWLIVNRHALDIRQRGREPVTEETVTVYE
jgi:hypothetical protein